MYFGNSLDMRNQNNFGVLKMERFISFYALTINPPSSPPLLHYLCRCPRALAIARATRVYFYSTAKTYSSVESISFPVWSP
jgi:hypothetical protein